MLSIFTKTSWQIEGKTMVFFDSLFSKLPENCSFLKEGLQKGLYHRYSENPSMGKGHYYVSFDPAQSDSSMIKGLEFSIKNIAVIEAGQAQNMDILVYNGLWIGFTFPKNIKDLKDFSFDLYALKIIKTKPAVDAAISKLVVGLASDQLDLENLSEFEIDNQKYYQIKDLEDGNYIAIDRKGRVYGLLHESNNIDLINNSVKEFVEHVNSGHFDLETYKKRK